MTIEEAKTILSELVEAKTNSGVPIIPAAGREAIQFAMIALATPKLPEELEEAAKEYARNYIPFDQCDFRDILRVFKAVAEWQKVQDQKTIELAEDHAMLAGMNKMEQQMMEGAVECVVENWNPEPHPEITIPLNPEVFGVGDKVRVIVIKEGEK